MMESSRKSSRFLSFSASRSDLGYRASRPLQTDKSVENTYQLGPHTVFQSFRAKRIAESVVKKRIPEEAEYEPEWAKHMSMVIANDVRKAVKNLPYDRYRYVVQVYMGQKRGQGVQCASRSIAEAATDSYDEYMFQNKSLWLVVLVHAMYLV